MRKKGLLILLLIFLSVLPIRHLFIKPAFNYLSGYLSKSEQVKANILLIEGWLPDFALEMVYQEFKKNRYEYIITTGLKSFTPYYKVSMDGYLIFYPEHKLKYTVKSDHHIIEIDAFSELEGGNSAHFNLFVNDSLTADFFAKKHKGRYTSKWIGSLSKIDSIMIQFTNDAVGEYGDRNLYVKEIVVDHKIKIPYQNNSEYDIDSLDGKRRIINNLSSSAELARNRLLSMGIDPALIIAIPARRVRINRTLTSALAFQDWLKTEDIDIKGINIISLGTHARRTWMTYNKILNEKYDIGIISLPDIKNSYSGKNKVLKTLREALGIIYYWFILMPY